MDKTEKTLELWCSGGGIDFRDSLAEQGYRERTRRIADAILLRLPDRVPVVPSFGMFPALNAGYTCEEVMFDYDKARQAWMRTLIEFEPDSFSGSGYAFSGPALEALDYRLLKLPGRGIPPESIYQFAEKEFVSAEEFYDSFLDDPTDFMLRVYLPRVCGALAPLKDIRPVHEVFGYYLGAISNLVPFGTPEFASMLDSLQEAGTEALRWAAHLQEEGAQIASMGFPDFFGGNSAAPFDLIGDWFRGTRGVMLDMYRNPERLLAAMERLVPIAVKQGVDSAKATGHPIVAIALHKGAEGFMSHEQFEIFYWPTLRQVMMEIIDEGFVPMPIFEGSYTARLDTIRDIPTSKALYMFETVDIRRAKEALEGIVCFKGNVPVSLLCTGTVQQVKEYVRELIDVFREGGGLMVDCGVFFDQAKYQNVKAMIDFTKEHGRY